MKTVFACVVALISMTSISLAADAPPQDCKGDDDACKVVNPDVKPSSGGGGGMNPQSITPDADKSGIKAPSGGMRPPPADK